MADAASIVSALPAALQPFAALGAGASVMALPVIAYLFKARATPDAPPVAAVVAPILSPDQVRGVLEAGAEALRLLRDIRDAIGNVEGAVKRVESAALDAARAAKDVEAAVGRAARG